MSKYKSKTSLTVWLHDPDVTVTCSQFCEGYVQCDHVWSETNKEPGIKCFFGLSDNGAKSRPERWGMQPGPECPRWRKVYKVRGAK